MPQRRGPAGRSDGVAWEILHKVDRISRVFLTGVRSTRKNQDPLRFGLVLLAGLLARVGRRGHDVRDDFELWMPQHRLAKSTHVCGGGLRRRAWSPSLRAFLLHRRVEARHPWLHGTGSPTATHEQRDANRGCDDEADREEHRDQPLHDPPQARWRSSSSTPPRGARSPWDRSPAIRHPETKPRPRRGRPYLERVNSPPSSDPRPGRNR